MDFTPSILALDAATSRVGLMDFTPSILVLDATQLGLVDHAEYPGAGCDPLGLVPPRRVSWCWMRLLTDKA